MGRRCGVAVDLACCGVASRARNVGEKTDAGERGIFVYHGGCPCLRIACAVDIFFDYHFVKTFL